MFLTPTQVKTLTGFTRHDKQVEALEFMGFHLKTHYWIQKSGKPVVLKPTEKVVTSKPPEEPDFRSLAPTTN